MAPEKRKKMRGQTVKYIPEEIMSDIFVRLPVKSLSRCMRVSKQWRYWISKTRRSRKLLFTSQSAQKLSFKAIREKTRRTEDIMVPAQWERKYQRGDPGQVSIYGSCDGLVLVGSGCDLYLWNPTIRYCEKIFAHRSLNPRTYRIVGGLYLDSLDKEYKIFMAITDKALRNGGDIVMVGNPRNKTWTHIRFPCWIAIGSIVSGPLLNNHLHFVAAKIGQRTASLTSPSLIIYFDGRSDEFINLPMPPPKEIEDFVLGLGVLDENLCMTRRDGDKVEVLVMKEYAVKESWSVLFRIEGVSFPCNVSPLCYIDKRKSEVLMMISSRVGRETFVYDSNSNSRAPVKFHDDDIRSEIAYEETFVRPLGYQWEKLDSRGEAFYVENIGSNCILTKQKYKYGYVYWLAEGEER